MESMSGIMSDVISHVYDDDYIPRKSKKSKKGQGKSFRAKVQRKKRKDK